jgi:predicted helicase
LKPLFTIHAGEFLVDCEIERKFRRVNVWIPAKDTGIDLLVSNDNNTKTLSLQVKFSRDYLATHMRDAAFHKELRACGWWTPTRQQIKQSRAEYWIFVLVGFANRSTDFIIIKPGELLTRLDAIHGKAAKKFQSYLWVTQKSTCWETRGLNRKDQLSITENTFENSIRNFTAYLNNWTPIKALND